LHRDAPDSKLDNSWEISFNSMFHMSNDSVLFCTANDFNDSENVNSRNLIRLYESKMIYVYNHRAGDFADAADGLRMHILPNVPSDRLCNPLYSTKSHYWVKRDEVESRLPEPTPTWLIGFRNVTDSRASARTVVACAIPFAGAGNSLPILFSGTAGTSYYPLIPMILSSFVFDFCARFKVGGLNLNFFIMKQLPFPAVKAFDGVVPWGSLSQSLLQFLASRGVELTFTSWDIKGYATDCGYDGPPFVWNEERRHFLSAELDAAFFHLYFGSQKDWENNGPDLLEMFPTPRHAVDYIMETFPIVKRKDIARTEVRNEAGEVVTPGTFITKDTILEIYDEMATAMATGVPYQTRLNPPPGPPTDANGNFIPMANWDSNNWPSHIHPPRSTNNEQPEAAR